MERDSQVSASPDSFSLISEPSDVRNWFPSYVYESPVLGTGEDFGDSVLKESEIWNLWRVESPALGTCEDFGDSVHKESEIRNPWRVFGNGRQNNIEAAHEFDDAGDVDRLNGDKKRELDFGRFYGTSGKNENGEESLTEAPDSLQSNLPTSERRYTGQIFVRDVHPSLGLHEECTAFISKSNGSEGKGCVAVTIDDGQKDSEAREEKSGVGIRSREELSSEFVKTDGSAEDPNHDKDECSTEFAGYSSSSSLISEPPHISNWFSSYVYESPDLDTLRDFGCIEHRCNVKDDLLVGEICNSKTETTCKLNHRKTYADAYTASKLIPSTNRSQREDQVNNELKENKNIPSDVLVSGVVTKVNSECNAVALSDNVQRRNDVLSLKRSGSCLIPEKEISRYPTGSNYGRNHMKQLSAANFRSGAVGPVSTRDNPGPCTVNQASARTTNGRISAKENLEPRSRSSGFVSIRKKAVAALGPGRKPQEVVLNHNQCLHVKRTPLVESTNLPTRQDDAVECAGKWKCPQKSKPFAGPPMKQLRLERWVHRV